MTTLLNVRETARRLGVHDNTVRNWEAAGFIHAATRSRAGYRKFAETEVARVLQVLEDRAAHDREEVAVSDLVPAGTKVPKATYAHLKWIAYKRDTTVSAIIASYVARCLAVEEANGALNGFVPSDKEGAGPL